MEQEQPRQEPTKSPASEASSVSGDLPAFLGRADELKRLMVLGDSQTFRLGDDLCRRLPLESLRTNLEEVNGGTFKFIELLAEANRCKVELLEGEKPVLLLTKNIITDSLQNDASYPLASADLEAGAKAITALFKKINKSKEA